MNAADDRGPYPQRGFAALLLAAVLALGGAVAHGGNLAAGSGSEAAVTVGAAQADPWVVSPRRAAVPNPLAKTEQVIAKGRDAYKAECATCHGQTGQNDGPGARKIAKEMQAALVLTDPRVLEQSDGALFWKITEGRNKMPSSDKELTEEERWATVHFLRTLAAGSR